MISMQPSNKPHHRAWVKRHTISAVLLYMLASCDHLDAAAAPPTPSPDAATTHQHLVPTAPGQCAAACPDTLICPDKMLSRGTHVLQSIATQPSARKTITVVDVEPPMLRCGAPHTIPWQPQLTIVPVATDNCNTTWHRALGTHTQWM